MINELKDIAFGIQIEPLTTVGRATKVNTVIKVLSDISHSYNNFLEIEFMKNDDFMKIYETNNQLIETVQEKFGLLIVGLNFSSFEAYLAPNLLELEFPLFNNEVLEWEKETYKEFKENVINGSFEDKSYIDKITNRYDEGERFKIFSPLFSSLGDGKEYYVNIKYNQNQRRLVLPETKKEIYLPKPQKLEKYQPEYKNVHAYLKVKKTKEGLMLNKKGIKEVYFVEEFEFDTYPFQTNLINFQEKYFVLNNELECKVDYEDGNYIIRNDELDISAWGETRNDAIEAFNFCFNSLYINFYNEADSNLTKSAITLKNKLKEIIKKVLDETQKS